MDHDRLFKQLLTTFFAEFIDLFLPEVSKYLDRKNIEFIDKEVFTGLGEEGEGKHEVDLLAQVKFKGQDAQFLVHVETQASAQPDFAQRMFFCFARLYEHYRLPVYPIAVFSYDRPLRAEPATHDLSFPDTTVLKFRFRAIQLNRLNWRDFVKRPNPVASALMAKMKIRPEDRPRVKLECLRLLATLRLDADRMQLIQGFVNSYLRLTREEMVVVREELKAMQPAEKEEVVQVLNEWVEEGMEKGIEKGLRKGREEGMEKGREEGLRQGKAEMSLSMLRRRFGRVPGDLRCAVDALSAADLQRLGDAILDLADLAQVRSFLSKLRR